MKEIIFLGVNEIVAGAAKWCSQHKVPCRVISTGKQFAALSRGNISFDKELQSLKDVTIQVCETPDDIQAPFGPETVAISVGAPWIFPKDVLEKKLPGNIFNVHGSHLPRMRGGTLFSWLILTGQRTGIALIHRMEKTIDCGPVVKFEEFLYPAGCRKPVDFINTYNQQNLDLLIEFITNPPNNKEADAGLPPRYLSSYWPRLSSETHGWINWEWKADEIERFICAFDDPYPGARTSIRDTTVVLKEVFWQRVDGYTHPFQSGMIYRKSKKWIHVAGNGGELIICRILDPSGNDMMPRVAVGDRFYTPQQQLLSSQTRVVKSENGFKVQEKL